MHRNELYAQAYETNRMLANVNIYKEWLKDKQLASLSFLWSPDSHVFKYF